MKLTTAQINDLVKIADLLDNEGMRDLANDADRLLSLAAGEEEPKKEEESKKEEEPKEKEVTEDDLEPSEDETPPEESSIDSKVFLKRFVQKFYKALLDSHTKFTRLVNKKELGYVGDEKREIIRMSFDTLLEAMQTELQKAQIEASSVVEGKMVDNRKMIKDVYKVFMPILNLYEEFERFMSLNAEFAAQFPRTRSAFMNLRNVLNNIIKSIPEEILDIEMAK